MSTIERRSDKPLTRGRQLTSRFPPRMWLRAQAHLPCSLRRPGTLLSSFQQSRWEGRESPWKNGCPGIRKGAGRAIGLDLVSPAAAQESGGDSRVPEELASGSLEGRRKAEGSRKRWRVRQGRKSRQDWRSRQGWKFEERSGSPRSGRSVSAPRRQPLQRGRVSSERQTRPARSVLRCSVRLSPIGAACLSVKFMGGTSLKHSCFFAALQ